MKRGRTSVIVQPDMIKQEIYNKFSPVFQHDCHEFFTYIMSTLQDEETPIQKSSTIGQTTSPEEAAWLKYEQTHPSIIDKLFSGKSQSPLTTSNRPPEDHRDLWQMPG